MFAIETQNLTKSYGRRRGISDVSLQVQPGEIFGFLGPNGAGKTTTIRTLLGLLRPTSGSARVLAMDIRRDSIAIRARTGYLPGEVRLYPGLTGRQLIELSLTTRRVTSRSHLAAIEERLGVDLNRRLGQCSKGMRQQVALALAMAHDPELLVLDEPTAGLDPLMQVRVLDLLREQRRQGKTVFFSSHNLPEVESICDRVAMIRDGRLILVEEVQRLRERRARQVEAELFVRLYGEDDRGQPDRPPQTDPPSQSNRPS